ncbi:OmpA family protein [Sphingobacterium faecale]|uniref:OmpA family protein n=1 Tax=Sphingobacterium faecale TaxID=2803775 RepID=A0ABS1R175_9SPHI|nr:OmpA family protein [Sphingobacterium faecale]MBL1408448.1 OmpA family protein [Sphingobacterium faecale]
MKKTYLIKIFGLLLLFMYDVQMADAQLFEKLKERVKQTAEDKVINKAGDATEKGMDKAEEKITNKKTGKDDKVSSQSKKTTTPEQGTSKGAAQGINSYANYDFVPGDKIIFQCDFADERDGELPGRLTLIDGNAEVQTMNGEKVLHVQPNSEMQFIPVMKNNKYLPEQFTLEFDVMMFDKEDYYGDLRVFFQDSSDPKATGYSSPHYVEFLTLFDYDKSPRIGWAKPGSSNLADIPKNVAGGSGTWKHIAIYMNKNIGKVYVDQHRIRAVNNLEPGADMLRISSSSSRPVYIKNIRLAQGGDDAYKKVISDGKFIAYGIQFDVNKSVLKPESMGTINEFVKMMKEKPELAFEIGGHTDGDGTPDRNNKLSQERADVVKAKMVEMGVESSRLTTKGYGSSNSIAENNSAENKAKNRRVEFVRK